MIVMMIVGHVQLYSLCEADVYWAYQIRSQLCRDTIGMMRVGEENVIARVDPGELEPIVNQEAHTAMVAAWGTPLCMLEFCMCARCLCVLESLYVFPSSCCSPRDKDYFVQTATDTRSTP